MADEAEERERQRRRKLEELEQRVLDLVEEDLRKEIPNLLADIHEESLKNKGLAVSPVTRTVARLASLLGALYFRTEIQTRRIVRLTWALVGLTVALLCLTAYLCYYAYLNEERTKQERKDQTEKYEP